MKVFAFVVGLVLATALAIALVVARPPERTVAEEARAELEAVLAEMRIPEFDAVDQEGVPIDRSIFEDRHTVLSFGFTYCTTVCPIMHGQMHRLTQMFEGTPVRFLLFSVDPRHDTPERLRAYAEQLGADTERWTFAVADVDTLGRIVVDGLGFGLADDPSVTITLPSGETMNNIAHSSRFLLVGPDVTLLDMCRGTDPREVDAFAARLSARLRG